MKTSFGLASGGQWAPQDWSEFFPDVLSGLIVGVLVGVAVGVVLYRWQRARERRDRKRASQRQWRLVGPQFALVMRFAYEANVGANSLPDNAGPFKSVVEISERMDLVAWASDDPENSELEIASRLVENSTTLLRLASELMDLIYVKWRVTFGASNANGSGYAAASSRIVLETVLTDELVRFEEGARQLLSDQELEKQANDYRAWLRQCRIDYDSLRNALRRNDETPRG